MRIIDVSSNNPHPINWSAVQSAGVGAVIVKATEGTNYTNPYYAGDVSNARAAGLQVLAYHFATFGNVQAELLYFKGVAGELAKVLDVETSTDLSWMNQFLGGLGPAASISTYGSASSLSGIHNQLHSQVWIAAYGQAYPGFGSMWQFTSSATVPGIAGVVDESQWMGTQSQFDALFGTSPSPSEEEEMPLYATNSSGTGFVIATDLSSKVGIPDANDAQELLKTNLYKTVTLTDQLINIIPNA